jgi:transcriptional regulator with XRE-family HTH domain
MYHAVKNFFGAKFMKRQIIPYTGHELKPGETFMPKRKPYHPNGEPFGQRLARLRSKIGYSQRDLAAEVSISQRMVAYYEGETEYPPAHLLPVLAKALGVSADELLGLEPLKDKKKAPDSRLWKRFKQVEKLPPQEKKQIVQLLDALLERQKLRQQAA